MHVDHLHREIFHAKCWEFRPLCDNYCFWIVTEINCSVNNELFRKYMQGEGKEENNHSNVINDSQ